MGLPNSWRMGLPSSRRGCSSQREATSIVEASCGQQAQRQRHSPVHGLQPLTCRELGVAPALDRYESYAGLSAASASEQPMDSAAGWTAGPRDGQFSHS